MNTFYFKIININFSYFLCVCLICIKYFVIYLYNDLQFIFCHFLLDQKMFSNHFLRKFQVNQQISVIWYNLSHLLFGAYNKETAICSCMCMLQQNLRLKMKRIEVWVVMNWKIMTSLFCKLKVMKKEMFIDS